MNSAGVTVSTPGNIQMETLQAPGGNQNVTDDPPGNIHVWKLPMGLDRGSIQFASFLSLSPSSMQVEVSLSRCPGDTSYWKTDTATDHSWGGSFPVCGGVGTGDNAGVSWASVQTFYQCGVPKTEQWYLNWRVLNNSCNRAAACGQTYYWF